MPRNLNKPSSTEPTLDQVAEARAILSEIRDALAEDYLDDPDLTDTHR